MSRGRAAELTALPAATADDDDDDCCTRNCVSMSWSGLLGNVVRGKMKRERERYWTRSQFEDCEARVDFVNGEIVDYILFKLSGQMQQLSGRWDNLLYES